MKISAILIARVLGFMETADLNRSGRAYLPNVVAGLVERFQFQKWPQAFEEMDETKGVQFQSGLWDGTPVTQLTIYNSGLVVETQVSTAESEKIMENALLWAAQEFGLSYSPGDIKRKRYVSDLTFHTEVRLLDAYAPVHKLTAAVAEHVSHIFGENVPYYGTRLDIDIQRHPFNTTIAPFSIQRRGDTPISENKYFSEAPLPTDVHIKLLEQFEAAVKNPTAV